MVHHSTSHSLTKAQLERSESEVKRLTFHLQQIASGAARDARVQAQVALGELPVGALLTPAPRIDPRLLDENISVTP